MDSSRTRVAPRNPRAARSAPALLGALLLFSGIATAAPEPAGRVLIAAGEVTAVRAGESARSLDRGDAVYVGDEIRTGRRGSVQVRFIDEGLVDLDPGTRFAIDEYRAGDDDAAGSVVMNFLRGALRTITGSIGGGDDTYRMNTPTATIGVRGTAYALQYCDADCAERIGVDSALGLHGRVDQGVVTVDTPQANAAFSAGDFFFVSAGSAPRVVVQPPAGILDGGDGDEDEQESRDGLSLSAAGGDSAAPESGIEAESSTTTDDTTAEVDSGGDTESSEPVVDGGDLSGGGTTLVGGSAAAAMTNGFADFGAGQVLQQDSNGTVLGASFGSGREIEVDTANATLLETGSDTSLGVGWGRWNGSFTVDGAAASGNLAFMVVDQFTDPGTLVSLPDVNASYSIPNPTGPSKNPGPSAFDRDGNLWELTALSFVVDFQSTNVTLSNLNLTGPGSGLITLSTNNNQTLMETFSVNKNSFTIVADEGAMSATVTGKFVGAAAEGMVTSFDATDGTANVTGVAVLAK
ncbi:MAG: FecR family protein [Halofilum sp. (in: g-proteobacteria)]|nr:FecR family protein [Halofilum sp. (in: g-proteobacteria)]